MDINGSKAGLEGRLAQKRLRVTKRFESLPRVAWVSLLCLVVACFWVPSAWAQMALATELPSALEAPSGATDIEQRFYAVSINGEPAGWQQELSYASNGQLHTFSRTVMSVQRGADATTMVIDESFKETDQHVPLEASVSQAGANGASVQKMVFTDGKAGPMRWSVQQGNQSQAADLPGFDQPWWTPGEVAAHAEQWSATGSQGLAYNTLTLSMGLGLSKVTITQAANAASLGNPPLPGARPWYVEQKLLPSRSQPAPPQAAGVRMLGWFDADSGKMLLSSMPLAGLQFESRWVDDSDRAAVQALIGGTSDDTFKGPEVLFSTMLETTKPLQRPRSSKRGVYQVTVMPDDDAPRGSQSVSDGAPVSAGMQQTTWDATASQAMHRPVWRVTVDTDWQQAEHVDTVDPACLAHSTLVGKDDPVIGGLVEQALATLDADLKQTKSPEALLQQANAFRGFVHQHLTTKNMASAMSSASQAARSQQGDCTEHAMLLAAMLRHHGIPARMVTGLVAVEMPGNQPPQFGGHMWTQAFIPDNGVVGDAALDTPGRWVDLDAAMPGARPFDAAHIALGVGSFSDATQTTDSLSAVQALGRLKLDILDQTHPRPRK